MPSAYSRLDTPETILRGKNLCQSTRNTAMQEPAAPFSANTAHLDTIAPSSGIRFIDPQRFLIMLPETYDSPLGHHVIAVLGAAPAHGDV